MEAFHWLYRSNMAAYETFFVNNVKIYNNKITRGYNPSKQCDNYSQVFSLCLRYSSFQNPKICQSNVNKSLTRLSVIPQIKKIEGELRLLLLSKTSSFKLVHNVMIIYI